MNNFFVDKVEQIKKELPPQTVDPLETLKTMMNGCPSRFDFTPVSPETTEKIIRNMRKSKACGVDNIDSYILKLTSELIVPPITHIINLSLSTGVFPAHYKTGKIVPLYKGKGSTLEPSSYRPVCLLPVASKVLERAIYLQVVEYMEKNKFFHPNHHGFRNNHNTTTALLQLYDSWIEKVDQQELSGVCLIDLSSAFDVVEVGLLSSKLKLYGWSDHARKWIESYMQQRSQVTYLEGSISPPREVKFGLPQGSILSPLFYIIFTNEFPETIHGNSCPSDCGTRNTDVNNWNMRLHTNCQSCGSIVIFADDSTYSTSDKDHQRLGEKLSDAYSTMANYLTSSGLKVNDDKTHSMLLTTEKMRRTRNIEVTVTTGDTSAATTEVERLLGSYVHHNMKWAEMIINNEKSLIKSLNTRTNALCMVKKVASFKVRKMIATGIWHSKLSYLIALYGGTEEYLLTALQRMQNKVARVICNRGKEYPAKKALKEVGWLPVKSLIKYHSLLEAKKCLENQSPLYLFEKLAGEKQEPRYLTRLKVGGDLSQDTFRLELTRKSWRWRVKSLWWEAPTHIRELEFIQN